MKKMLLILLLICLQLSTGVKAQEPEEGSVDFEILKNLELFEMVYKKVDMEYVDAPDPGKLMRVAIESMLKELDPYTNYIPESMMEEFKLMTTGQYGGIGAIIRDLGDYVGVIEPHEGYAAQKAGLRAGDLFVEVDGKDVKNLNTDEVSSKLKGKPGSVVKAKVLREGKFIDVSMIREEVKLSPVPWYGMYDDKIGYIKFTSFTQTAHADVAKAFFDLKKNKGMRRLILDLRGNGGGLLFEAVKIVNMFVAKGTPIVSVRGRHPEDDKVYSASLKPDDLEMPIVVLVDDMSASASEIVSGALQDMDRAVIVGQTSYGKGLVQRPLELKYNAQLKVTIAKYYTPSGRCIQKLDYTHREDGESAAAISDSLVRKFKTANGRVVLDGRGIEPDVPVEIPNYSRLTSTLLLNDIIFDFATDYRNKHDTILAARKFALTDELYKEFTDFVMTREFTYSSESFEKMESLRKTAEDEGLLASANPEFLALIEKFKPSKERDMNLYKNEITLMLEDEIVGRYYYLTGRIAHSLEKDPFISAAVEILNDSARYNKILNKEN